MRAVAIALIVMALVACSAQTAASPSRSSVSLAQTQAADMRTHLDLLLAEHVMIVAKESAAALNHSDDYPAYTALLGANTTDLATMFGRAFGTTAATQFLKVWNVQNGYLVDYAIGVVAHDDDKTNAAISGLTGTFVPQFGQMIEESTGLPANAISQIARQQIRADTAFIEDLSAQKFASYYADLDKAYTQSSQLGDAMARQMVMRFPDRFSGDPSAPAVNGRVASNLLLQEHSYLATMATKAAVAKWEAEKTAAVAALAANSKPLDKAWSAWDGAVMAYATGGVFQSSAASLALATGASQADVQHLVDTTLKVIDDQKAKNSKSLAGDDRAAATAMQPIADASVQG